MMTVTSRYDMRKEIHETWTMFDIIASLPAEIFARRRRKKKPANGGRQLGVNDVSAGIIRMGERWFPLAFGFSAALLTEIQRQRCERSADL